MELFEGKGAALRMRTEQEILCDIADLLTHVLAELKHSNSADRTGAVSSVEIKDLASGKPQVTTKVYAGSEPPVDEALEAHARAHRQAEAAALNGWQETIDGLKAEASK